MTKKYILVIFILTVIFSCNQKNKKNISVQNNDPAIVKKVTKSPDIYDIDVEEGKYVGIRKGPGEQYEKIINVKATEALGYTDYINVGYPAKVIIQETNGDWSKIKVVEPEWLSASHIGWIPTKNIIKSKSEDEENLKNLDSKDYEIIKIEHNPTVQNFHILINQKEFDKESVFIFIKRFRNEHCTMDCNVLVYDSKSILPLIDKDPLEGNDYINLADHFISMSTFDAVNVNYWYPFQDFLYKDYGGNNWKKEEIK